MGNKPIRVLLVEDSPDDADLVARELRTAYQPEIVRSRRPPSCAMPSPPAPGTW
ncbi:MAG: hypothetical protein QM820_12295 [Minicystis sp.]